MRKRHGRATQLVRAFTLALAALLAGCQTAPRSSSPPSVPIGDRPPPVCRVGPDDGPLAADRGIGGTGRPPGHTIVTADRGIGGTGSPVRTADRGIGGTGIIAVITGFASLCLAGQEVALPPDVAVAIDQSPSSTDALRAGQVVAVDAAGDSARLRARRIVIRYEVVGRVERADAATLRVAGQSVALSPDTRGLRPAPGDWVSVSGLRRSDGTIEATRIDRQPLGPILVHGPLVEQGGSLRVAALAIRRDPATVALAGQDVTITGVTGQNGELLPDTVTPDLLAVDPAAFFGPGVGTVLIEAYGALDGSRLRLAPGFSAPAAGVRLDGSQRGVFRFERFDGRLRATGVLNVPAGFGQPSRFDAAPRFEPAPMPDRSFRGGANEPSNGGNLGRPHGGGGRAGGDRIPQRR